MKKVLVLLSFVLVMVFTSGQATALNEWTFIIYMVNDDDETAIENANIQNLNEMVRIGSGKDYEIIVQMDGRGSGRAGGFFGNLFGGKKDDLRYSGGQRILVQKGSLQSEGKLGEVNMGSPYCLWDCLKWAHQKHPAKHYALIFNSHGSGVFSWRGTGGTSSAKPGAVDFNPDRFVAYDDTDSDCLTVFEISAVMQAFRERLNMGRKMDIVGFDACLPAGIEVLHQMREGFEYMIGSPDTTPINGFNYRGIVEVLASNPSYEPEKFAVAMAQKLGSRYIGAWRTARSQEISFALNNIAMESLKAMKETGQAFKVSGMKSYGGKDRYWDLGNFASALSDGRSSLATAKNGQIIKQLGKDLLEALDAARATSFGQLTVAWPTTEEYKKFRAFYKALDFAQTNQWDEVMDHGMK